LDPEGIYRPEVISREFWWRRKYGIGPSQGTVTYISEFQNKLAWKFGISVSAPLDDESTSPHLPCWLFWPPPQKRKNYIVKISKKSLISLVVISYNLKQVKISYANGSVSVRIFYKNNLISFRF
jgi:hypothetical protein